MTTLAFGSRRLLVGLAAAVALAGGASCGSADPLATTTPTSAPTSATTSAGPSTSSTSTSTVPPGHGFSDADDGRSATVAPGERVTVILHSSDFVFAPPSDVSVLRADGEPTVALAGPTCTQVAGAGCGAVVASFVALAPGIASIAADRAGCIDLECPPEAAHWELTVEVAGGAPTDPTTTTTAPPVSAPPEAEVRGTVRFSPVCPVESLPPDPACAPRPGSADIELVRPDGTVAATTRASDDGAFAFPVAPGPYSVRAGDPSGRPLGTACQVEPAEIDVHPATTITVAVTCDTGVR